MNAFRTASLLSVTEAAEMMQALLAGETVTIPMGPSERQLRDQSDKVDSLIAALEEAETNVQLYTEGMLGRGMLAGQVTADMLAEATTTQKATEAELSAALATLYEMETAAGIADEERRPVTSAGETWSRTGGGFAA